MVGYCGPLVLALLVAGATFTEAEDPVCAEDADSRAARNLIALQLRRGGSTPAGVDAPPSLASLPQEWNRFIRKYDWGHPAWLSECKEVFLDLGSNRGVQVRKFYEPALYPNAPLVKSFSDYFGPSLDRCQPGATSGMCVLGFEPDPPTRLAQIEAAYQARGWYVHFYPVAVWDRTEEMGFQVSGDPMKVGSHVTNDGDMKAQKTVQAVNITEFVQDLPRGVVRYMKMDIEGSEWDVFASLKDGGALCKEFIQAGMVELHGWGENRRAPHQWTRPMTGEAVEAFMREEVAPTCPNGVTAIQFLDEEAYYMDVNERFGEYTECPVQPGVALHSKPGGHGPSRKRS